MAVIQKQLRVLVHLARADDDVSESEVKLIHHIGGLNGLSIEEIDDIIDNPGEMPELGDFDPDSKFECLHHIVQLMKVDGKVFQSEIKFCERVALKLGYRPGVIADLSAYVYSDPNINTKKTFLRGIADGQLIPIKKK
jgi:uncharacterized tellurite resistance protein B-like protein